MKLEIENKLKILRGLPLTNAGRAGGMAWLHFGKLSAVKSLNGSEKIIGEYALHIQCSWKLIRVSAGMFTPSCDSTEIVANSYNLSRDAERIIDTIKGEISVLSVEADSKGNLKIIFTENYLLELLADGMDDSNEIEYWRFFIPNNPSPHFVVTNNGIE